LLAQKDGVVCEMKTEYLYRCDVCKREHWDSLYVKPLCVHENAIAYEMKHVHYPTHHEETGAIMVSREVEE
jgi:hypothetical protein